MKWLVVSDNHFDKTIVDDLVHVYKDDVDAFIHCGDSQMSANDKVWENYYVVKGNNDYGEGFPKYLVTRIGDYKLFITHGHKYGVGYSLEDLTRAAKEENVDFVFFGHTHKPTMEQLNDVWAINPGSIYEPRQLDGKKTYLIMTLDGEKFDIQFYDDNHQKIADKFFSYSI